MTGFYEQLTSLDSLGGQLQVYQQGPVTAKTASQLANFSWLPSSPTISQGLQILLMSGVTVTSASQILESFWNIWSEVSQ